MGALDPDDGIQLLGLSGSGAGIEVEASDMGDLLRWGPVQT